MDIQGTYNLTESAALDKLVIGPEGKIEVPEGKLLTLSLIHI